jgi:hypothetical protein
MAALGCVSCRGSSLDVDRDRAFTEAAEQRRAEGRAKTRLHRHPCLFLDPVAQKSWMRGLLRWW